MDRSDVSHDGQAKTCASRLFASRFIDSVKALENVGEIGGGNADSLVGDAYLDAIAKDLG